MNFKTTIALIALLGVAGIVLYFTHEKPADQSAENTAAAQNQKLIDVQPADVSKLVITPADGKAIALERDGMNWRMTQPVAAAADSSAADSLVSALVGMTSSSKVETGGNNASVTGLDQPNFRVEVTTKSGNTNKLAIGNKSATGGNSSTAAPRCTPPVWANSVTALVRSLTITSS